MAPPNKLFSPILSTCIGTSVLLLLLLLFLLYKYNQVRFPVARQELQGLPSLAGSAGSHRQGPSRWEVPRRSPPLPPNFPQEFPAAGQGSCTKPRVFTPLPPWCLTLAAQKSMWIFLGAKGARSVLSREADFALVTMNHKPNYGEREKKKSGLHLASTFYSPPCF